MLLQLCEAEAADRRERKRERLLRESKLPAGKTLGNLEEAQLPARVRRQLPTLLEGGFIDRAENLLVFGLPGRGKTHFLCALGRELILRHGYKVAFTSTFKLVPQLLAARKDLRLDGQLKKLDHFRRFTGKKIRVRVREMIGGRRSFLGLLKEAGETGIVLLQEGVEFRIPFTGIEKANYEHDWST